MSNGDDLLTGTDIDFTVSEESIENVHNLETVSDWDPYDEPSSI